MSTVTSVPQLFRVAPATRELIESVLREGETLSTFIEESARERAQWRKEDEVFYAEAQRRSERVKAGKMKTISHEETMQGLRDRLAHHRATKATA